MVEALVGDRYYWLKLGTDFFSSDDMKVVLAQKNGSDYAVFWIRLLLKAVQSSDPGLLRFKADIPYSIETLSTVTDTDIDTVSNAIKLFQRLGMLRIAENGDMWVESVNEMIGSEVTSAKRVRAFRARQAKALQGNNDVTPMKLEKRREEKEKNESKTSATKEVAKKAHPLYKQVQDAFLSVQPDNRFVSFPKEGKAINRLIAEAEARCPEDPWEWIRQVMGAFADLHQGRDNFWKGQPILPSVLMSNGILPRVLQHMTEEDFTFEEVLW